MQDTLLQQQNVSAAFSKQSSIFDVSENGNPILEWMRSRVRAHALTLWKPGEHVLELNAGTGLDALYFSENGIYVHATDNSEGMLTELKKKANDKITIEKCSFLEINKIKGEFDHIFSNFGGLNCTNRLDLVIESFYNLLKPGGTATLVIMPPICPWEMAKALKGDFRTAARRLRKGGTPSNVEGVGFKTYYYSPKQVTKMFGEQYGLISIKALGCFVPPPYAEKFAHRHPKLLKVLKSLEDSFADIWPFYAWADHFLLTAKKKGG